MRFMTKMDQLHFMVEKTVVRLNSRRLLIQLRCRDSRLYKIFNRSNRVSFWNVDKVPFSLTKMDMFKKVIWIKMSKTSLNSSTYLSLTITKMRTSN